MTPTTGTTIFWAMVGVIAIVAIGLLYRGYIAPARTRRSANGAAAPSPDEAQRLSQSAYEVALNCRIGGHAYLAYNAGWRCATCGNYVARREGELYGPAGEGRTDRRRQER